VPCRLEQEFSVEPRPFLEVSRNSYFVKKISIVQAVS
jgi:hypothetical protein